MQDFLVIYVVYSICASAALIRSTLLNGRGFTTESAPNSVEYIPVSDCLLFEWAAQDSNVMVFDVHVDHGIGEWDDLRSRWLPVSIVDLPSLTGCLPPASRVAFCCRDAVLQLDPQTKTTLLRLGIKTVYFLDQSVIPTADSGNSGFRARRTQTIVERKNHRNEGEHP